MAEIYRDSVNKAAEFSVPGATVKSAWIERKGVSTDTTFTQGTGGGPPLVLIPYSVTRYDGKFDVVVDYEIEGREYQKRDTHEVITPLFSPQELIEFDPDFNSLVNKDGKNDDEKYAAIHNLERLIRTLFETITGQKFGLEYGTVVFPGSGSKMIGLPKRALDVKPYENSNDISAYGFTNITNDGWVLRASPRSSWIQKFEPDNSTYARATFSRDKNYSLTGLWGYHSPPEDIVLAAKILASDYGCEQAAWRDKWIKSIRAADWRIEFDSRAYLLTGNVKVDQLLDKYTRVRMVVL